MQTKKPLTARTSLKTKTRLSTSKPLQARTKPKRQPKPPITRLRKKADKLFSQAIRYRDSELIAGSWMATCITCDLKKPFGSMHCGHFQSRRYPATRWDELNAGAQCPGCNTFNGGEQYRFAQAIDLRYGSGTANKLQRKARSDFKLTRAFLEKVIAKATEEIDFFEKQA